MGKRFLILVFLFVTCVLCPAEEMNFLAGISPKLRKLVTGNAAAMSVLTNACSSAFRTNSVQLVYFYSEDDSRPRAVHYYPHTVGQADVMLCIRENQEPWDEFISIVFELLNSKNENRFEVLFERAKAGSIGKTEFAMGVIRIEFDADIVTRDLLKGMKLSRREKARSYFYNRFLGCPDGFEDFLGYQRKVSPRRDLVKQYEAMYEGIRDAARQ
jgi:hypothetical protein